MSWRTILGFALTSTTITYGLHCVYRFYWWNRKENILNGTDSEYEMIKGEITYDEGYQFWDDLEAVTGSSDEMIEYKGERVYDCEEGFIRNLSIRRYRIYGIFFQKRYLDITSYSKNLKIGGVPVEIETRLPLGTDKIFTIDSNNVSWINEFIGREVELENYNNIYAFETTLIPSTEYTAIVYRRGDKLYLKDIGKYEDLVLRRFDTMPFSMIVGTICALPIFLFCHP